ncbi:MAG: adenylate/guanylate cyclase domain-containing protein [Armatimonadetes bacterium]|nr:adenylate/guanylate cyclase domain-containing protein [Armatimonadota bacterium]
MSEDTSRRPRNTVVGPILRCSALGIALGVVSTALFLPGWPLHALELRTLDARYRFRTTPPPPSDVVIIAIDEASIRDPRLGRWEWDRIWHARLLRRLRSERPRAIAYDVIFSEPSRGRPDDDVALAAATREAGCVIHAAYPSDQPIGAATKLLVRQGQIRPQIVVHQGLAPRVAGVMQPIAPLAQAAAGTGVIAGRPDPDGTLRRACFLIQGAASGHFYPTFELATAARAQKWDPGAMRFDLASQAVLTPGQVTPLDDWGNALVNFLGPTGTVPRYSFRDVLDGRFSPGTFTDKIVLVGLTAPGLQDFFVVPYPGGMFGVEIHAQVLENMLHNSFLTEVNRATVFGLAILLGILGALMARLARPVVGFAALLLALVVYNALAMRAFSESRTVWPMLGPGLALLAAYLPTAAIRLATEEGTRRRLRTEFGRYAPPQLVARLEAGELQARSAGVLRTVTALFADVRGFTAWMGTADPRAVVSVLNTYFGRMTELAFDLDGTVDNLVGDEIFITFNALDDQPDHMVRAAHLAVNMVHELDALNRCWQEEKVLDTPLRIGIGISSGEAVVGNLGSQIRTQYTALGSVINLASRLQGLNKELGTTILVTRSVAEAVAEEIESRPLGEQNVRGHPEPVEVFELTDRKRSAASTPPAPAPGE